MWEGAPDYPEKGIWWEIVERYRVTILYCAPTAIRACIKWGAKWPEKHDLSSLRLLGSVGEPINPKAWLWYHKVIGAERCPIVDTWWQTETGAIMITPLPGITETKPGSATQPFPGRRRRGARRVHRRGRSSEGQGLLVLTRPWPSMLRTLYKEDERFIETYFSASARRPTLSATPPASDKDGYFWVIGRIDDVVNVSGHRLSTAEVESAIVAHADVAEAAVIGQHDEDTGQAIVAFVTLQGDLAGDEEHDRGHPRHGRRADRQVRPPQAHHLGRRPAQDPLGQDHAPPAARHRRGPGAGRRDHAARSRRDGAAAVTGFRAPGRRGLGPPGPAPKVPP